MRIFSLSPVVLVIGLATLSMNTSGAMIALCLVGLAAIILIVLLAATVVMAEVERLDDSALE
ncbi:hypothetical protein [Bradyrhizobium sp. McL0615]|uniref:hypothetical protein n=1 Tax=Bradyrhizobium sp. McL0615 TaxID=3415673 RepID=UPI003CF106BC